jgi:hypothetical protein
VGKHFFGGRTEAINTIAMMYEDLLKVILVHDSKDWSEEAILSIFADRTPFLTSYLNLTSTPITTKNSISTLTAISDKPKRLLFPSLVS